MNITVLTGRLARDPELRSTATGTSVTTFVLAVDRFAKDKQKQTDWIPVTVWGQLAANCDRHLHKGSRINVKGRLQSRTYTDRQGNNRTAIEVVADAVDYLDPKETKPADPTPAAVEAEPAADWEAQAMADMEAGLVDSSDLPF